MLRQKNLVRIIRMLVCVFQDRVNMEKMTVEALNTLEGELKGTYYPLTGMSKETQKQLTEDHFLFNDSDRSVGSPLVPLENTRTTRVHR